MENQKAIFGAGCFWGVESAFRGLEGVTETRVGYCGGKMEGPTYKMVCTDTTGHAEVVEVTFDPTRISYEKLLDEFWALHDPTQLNRQGPDHGSQYRTVIFCTTDEQLLRAEESKLRLGKSGQFGKPIATSVERADTFWEAEEYHQQYLEKQGLKSCHIPRR